MNSEDCCDACSKRKTKKQKNLCCNRSSLCIHQIVGALSKVLKLPPSRPNTNLSAYLSFEEASHFSSRCVISAQTPCEPRIDRLRRHKGHFISVMRAAGQKDVQWTFEGRQRESDFADKWFSSNVHSVKKKKKRSFKVILRGCGH